MSGIHINFSEPVFPHLQTVDESFFSFPNIAIEQDNQPVYTVKSYLLPLAFLVSLAIHGCFLFIKLSAGNTARIAESPNVRIHIELTPSIQHHPRTVQAEVYEPVPVQIPATDKPEQTAKVIEPTPDPPVVISSLTPDLSPAANLLLTTEELNAITNSAQGETEPSDAQLTEVSSEPFGSVFDPRLRARLQARNSSGRAKGRGLSAIERDNGSMVVEVSEGHCLVTQPQFSQDGTPTNWYHSGCGNKTESERMMERVNESMRLRYKKTP